MARAIVRVAVNEGRMDDLGSAVVRQDNGIEKLHEGESKKKAVSFVGVRSVIYVYHGQKRLPSNGCALIRSGGGYDVQQAKASR